MADFAATVERAGVRLSVEEAGEGIPVVLLHGLTATRRYVVMGSRALERSGHRVIAYDARGHGQSTPAPAADAYGYDELAADLAAVLDELEVERAVLAGASMGAHTALRLALDAPERVAGARGDHARRTTRRRPTTPTGSRAGTRSRRACARAGWRGSSRPTASPPCPSAGATPSDRSCASA